MAGKIKNNKHLINAPAGSGKTTYIRNELKSICLNNPESRILCITYTNRAADELKKNLEGANITVSTIHSYINDCNGVQREHNKKLNNGLPILHKVPPKRDYGRYFCIMAEKGGTSHGGLTEKLSPFFHAKKQEVNAYGR